MSLPEENTEDFVRELTSCQDDLLFFILSLVGNHSNAADIRQDVNVVLWRKREAFETGTNFKAWAFQVAKFEVKNHFRRVKKTEELWGDPELLELFASEIPAAISQLPERRVALRECVRSLTPKDTELLKHHYWSKLNLEALATSTNRSVNTLKARLFQLRHSLRQCINRRLQPGNNDIAG